jgi:hypothetical protein
MNNYLDPDHWVNGGEVDSCCLMAKAFSELEEENKRLRAALERIAKGSGCRDVANQIAREALICIKHNCEKATDKSFSTQSAFPPETRITVNGKTFCLADIDKEMTE